MTNELKYSCMDKNDIIVRIVRENEYLKSILSNRDDNEGMNRRR